MKKSCNYITATTYNKIKYGRECGDICDTNSDRCINHLNSKDQKFELFAENNTCEHIITQQSRGKDRKGMTCGKFTFDSQNAKYCKSHAKQHPEIDVNDPNKCLRTFKVRCKATKEQHQKLNKFFGDARFTYNKCVEDIVYDELDFENARDKYVTNFVNEHKFLKQTPKEIRTFAVKEYMTNVDNANDAYDKKIEIENWKKEQNDEYVKKQIKKPKMNYRKKKASQSITINKNSVNIKDGKLIIYPDSFSTESLIFATNRHIEKDIRFQKILKGGIIYHDIKIIRTLTNKYYICFTDDHIKKETTNELKVVAGDTGGRTLITLYDENGVQEIGHNMSEQIEKMLNEKDKLKKKYRNQMQKIKKTRMADKAYKSAKNKYRRINEKIQNRINDMHYKAIAKLMEYSLICIPKLNIKQIIRKEGNLTQTAKRVLVTEKHCQFLKRLQEKGEQHGKIVKIVDEYLTTKTCSGCFGKYDVKADKVYICPTCKLVIDRDINAARNIYIQQIALLISQIILLLK